MKTSELIEKMEGYGFKVEYIGNKKTLWITAEPNIIASVGKEKLFKMDASYEGFSSLPVERRKAVFDDLVEYTSTPIKDRDEKKRYRYKLKDIADTTTAGHKRMRFLNYYDDDDAFTVDGKSETRLYKTIFKENDPLLKRVNLDMFDKIEVDEDGNAI